MTKPARTLMKRLWRRLVDAKFVPLVVSILLSFCPFTGLGGDSGDFQIINSGIEPPPPTPIQNVDVIGLKDVISSVNPGFIALMRNEDYTGPNDDDCQMVLYRAQTNDFQCLRRWITKEEFDSGTCVSRASDPACFNEVFSVVKMQIYHAYFDSQNLVVYNSGSSGVIPEAVSGMRNMLLGCYADEDHWFCELCGSGLGRVSNINKSDGNDKNDILSVSTYVGSNALVRVHRDAASRRTMFEFYSGDEMIEKSEYCMSPQPDDPRLLASVKCSSVSNGIEHVEMEAKIYAIPDTFPSLEDLHKSIFEAATSNHRFQSIEVISNDLFYDLSPSGKLVLPAPRGQPGAVHPSIRSVKQAKNDRMITLFLALPGLAIIAVIWFRYRKSR